MGPDPSIAMQPRSTLRRRRGPLLVMAAWLAAAGPAGAARERVALVIGNSAYADSPLENPVRDARAVADALRDADFDVIFASDASLREMSDAVRRFGRRLDRARVGVFYYAGHGVQREGRNYLVPVGADIGSADEIPYETLDAGRVLAKMESANNGLNMVFLDACRNDPFGLTRSGSRGLAILNYPRGTLLSYATAPGDVAVDGSGRHSPYASHLVRAIETPGLELRDAVQHVARGVMEETGGRQRPWVSFDVLADFYFHPPPEGEARVARLAPAPGPPAPASPPVTSRPPEGPAPGGGWLVVRSNVFGDHWSLDGRPVGPTGPDPVSVSPGVHRVRVEKPGHRAFEVNVQVGAGETRSVHAVLQRAGAAGRAGPPPTGTVRIPAGSFYRGCNERVNGQCATDEKPGSTMTLAAFEIDRTEVTVAAYRRCVAAGACSAYGLDFSAECTWSQSGFEHHPVTCLDWEQARAYCEWKGMRLPTEWEWEKAARGGDARVYAWGNLGPAVAGTRVANIADRSAPRNWRRLWLKSEEYDDGHPSTAPVGSFPDGASPYGALDMMGNVWEWTSSEYPDESGRKVVRGGSWNGPAWDSRTARREPEGPSTRRADIGLRCAR